MKCVALGGVPVDELKITNPDRLSHAYLISAPDIQAAIARAMVLAAAAVCSGEGEKPCNRCRACRKVAENIHPDVITLARLEDDKGRLKREISVDQIRQLSADACIMPNEAPRKVYIIREAETMNLPAQNAALKLLEEPPLGALFLLCTTNASQLLPTVRSRCVELNLTGAQAAPDQALAGLAAAYLKAVASGDRARLFRWCAENEGMDGRTVADFVACVTERLGDMLCARQSSQGLSHRELHRLCALMDRCGAYLRVNVGPKHIFGLLAVDSIAGSGNRGYGID